MVPLVAKKRVPHCVHDQWRMEGSNQRIQGARRSRTGSGGWQSQGLKRMDRSCSAGP